MEDRVGGAATTTVAVGRCVATDEQPKNPNNNETVAVRKDNARGRDGAAMCPSTVAFNVDSSSRKQSYSQIAVTRTDRRPSREALLLVRNPRLQTGRPHVRGG